MEKRHIFLHTQRWFYLLSLFGVKPCTPQTCTRCPFYCPLPLLVAQPFGSAVLQLPCPIWETQRCRKYVWAWRKWHKSNGAVSQCWWSISSRTAFVGLQFWYLEITDCISNESGPLTPRLSTPVKYQHVNTTATPPAFRLDFHLQFLEYHRKHN